jgi:hypothetical protein
MDDKFDKNAKNLPSVHGHDKEAGSSIMCSH